MERGAIIRTASIAERHPAAPADIPQPIMEITATQPVRGASILTLSIAEAKPAPAAVHRPMITRTIVIPMGHGQKWMIRSTSARKRVLPAAILARNMPITEILMLMASATIAARPSV